MSDKSQFGFGVLINMLSGNEDTVKAFQKGVGQVISSVTLGAEDNALHFIFDNGYKMRMWDDGQSCCESRYMRTDDDLSYYTGATLLGASTKDAPTVEEEYDVHEVQFLEIRTSKGVFTMSNHNEHNGYYGGFSVVVREDTDALD